MGTDGEGMKPLTPRQQRFVREYRIDLNATQAAIRAGYSKNGADVQGVRLLGNARIKAEILQHTSKALEKKELTAERILNELSKIAFCNVLNYYDDNGELRPIAELREECGPEIAGLETIIKNAAAGDGKTDRVLKVKTWDKPKALEVLAKHFGLLQEKVEHVHIHVEIESRLSRVREYLSTKQNAIEVRAT
jgi:phage terminase small subunit